MAASAAALAGIEVNGKTGLAILQGFGKFTLLGSRYLLEEGIGEPEADGSARIDRQAWYPLEKWLRVLERVRSELGERVLAQIGWAMPRGGPPPPAGFTVFDALGTLDAAYHFNHRRDGVLFYDLATKVIREGIGNYRCEMNPAQKTIVVVCDTPYPCAFDFAVVHSATEEWQPNVRAHHEAGACRSRGATSCTYRLTWS